MITDEFIDYSDWVAYLAKNFPHLDLDEIQDWATRLTKAGHSESSRVLTKEEYLQRLNEMKTACTV